MKNALILFISSLLIITAVPTVFAEDTSILSESSELTAIESSESSVSETAASENSESEAAVSEASESSEVNIASSDNNAPAAAESVSYTAYIKKDMSGRWFAWTWGQGEDRWVRGWETDCYYDTYYETYYKFENLDSNVVLVCFDWSNPTPSWTDNSIIKQTVDIQLDNINKEFVVSDENSEGKLTGYLTSIDESRCGNEPEAATSEAAAPMEAETSENPDPIKPTHSEAAPATSEAADPTGNDKPINQNTSKESSAVMSLNLRTATVKCGKVITLKVYNNGGKTVKYISSNKKVAKVSSKGKVYALKKGIAKITAKVGTKKLYFTIKVTSSPKLSKNSLTIRKGKTKTVTVIGKCAKLKNTYNSTKRAKIISKRTASKLKVKALRKGSTTLRVRVNGALLKLKVKVI